MFGANDYKWTDTDLICYEKLKAQKEPNKFKMWYYSLKFNMRNQLHSKDWEEALKGVALGWKKELERRAVEKRVIKINEILSSMSIQSLFDDRRAFLESLDDKELNKRHKRATKKKKVKYKGKKFFQYKDILKSLPQYGDNNLLNDFILATTTALLVKAKPQKMTPQTLYSALNHHYAGIETAKTCKELIYSLPPFARERFNDVELVCNSLLK